MKKTILILALALCGASCAVTYGEKPTNLDNWVVSRLQAKAASKRLVKQELVGSNLVVRTFVQMGKYTVETNTLHDIAGAKVPTRYSRLKLYAVLAQAGLWDRLEAWLRTQTYNGMNAWTAFQLAEYMTDDNPLFTTWYAAAKQALQIDDATADALLKLAEDN